jgi:intein-encoded DNA endonuclease-like protein
MCRFHDNEGYFAIDLKHVLFTIDLQNVERLDVKLLNVERLKIDDRSIAQRRVWLTVKKTDGKKSDI